MSLCVFAIAVASRLPTDSTTIRSNRLLSGRAIVFATASSSIGDAFSRSTAGPERSACVAQQYTARAPSRFSAAAASVTVPAVSIRSSGMRQSFPSTSPTTLTTSAMFADGRRLSMIASDALSRLAKPRAILADPTSGATTTGSCSRFCR